MEPPPRVNRLLPSFAVKVRHERSARLAALSFTELRGSAAICGARTRHRRSFAAALVALEPGRAVRPWSLVAPRRARGVARTSLLWQPAALAIHPALRHRHLARPNPSLHLTFASRLRRLAPAGELKR